jgi:hypothetical protein
MELVSARALGPDESGRFEDVEVLGDGLSGGAHAVPGDEAIADLEQGLAVAIGQLVQNRAPGSVRQRLEQVTHPATIGKSSLACQACVPCPHAKDFSGNSVG